MINFILDEGEGNGTPLQYSCLENPMDGGAWWAAVHGVVKSRTRLSDFTFAFHFSCTGAFSNGNPLQCSCLENPRDEGACWAAVYGVSQSWTRLKRCSNSSILDEETIFCCFFEVMTWKMMRVRQNSGFLNSHAIFFSKSCLLTYWSEKAKSTGAT